MGVHAHHIAEGVRRLTDIIGQVHEGGARAVRQDQPMRERHAKSVEKRTGNPVRRIRGIGMPFNLPTSPDMKDLHRVSQEGQPQPKRKNVRLMQRGPQPE